MLAHAALRPAAPALGAAPLMVALALGITAHLLGAPFGHEGSLRDVLLLIADLSMVGVLARRGEFAPARLLASPRRSTVIVVLAVAVAAGLVLAEGAPDGLFELLASSAIIALSALLAAATLVVCAECAAEAAHGVLVALVRWLRRIDTNERPAPQRRHRRDGALYRREHLCVRSRRGPP